MKYLTFLVGASLIAPCLAAAGPAASGPDHIAAGGTYQVKLDPGNANGIWTINWGDGTPVSSLGTSVTSANHVYATKGVMKLTATLASGSTSIPVGRAYAPLVAKANPALYYHFNDLSGTEHIGSAYAKTGTLDDIPSISSTTGTAMNFGGAGHLDIAGQSAGEGAFLGLEFWLRPDDLTAKQVIFAGKGTANGTPIIYIENGKLCFEVVGSGIKSIDLGPEIVAGTWHHFGVSFERSRYFRERNTVRIYIDGYCLLDDPFERSASIPLSYTGATIGARDTGGGNIANRLDGALDEIVLHSLGIFPSGIHERYQAAATPAASWNVTVGVDGSENFTVNPPNLTGETVNVELDPDPAADNQATIQNAIDQLPNDKRLKFVAKGTSAGGGTYHLRSSVSIVNQYTRHFTVQGKTDVKIDGNGAELITHKGVTKFLTILNSNRVAVRNLTFDIADDSWRVGLYAQIKGVRASTKEVDVRFVKGAALTPDTTVPSNTPTWRWRSVDPSTRVPNTRQLPGGRGFITEKGSTSHTVDANDSSYWTYKLKEDSTDACWTMLNAVMANNGLVQINNAHFGGTGLTVNGCTHVTVDRVNFHAITGMVALTSKNDYLRIANCRVGLKPGLTAEDKPFSSASDAFHFDSGGGNVIFENNDVALTDDDAVAIKDSIDRNTEWLSSTTMKVGVSASYPIGTAVEFRTLELEALSPPFTANVTHRVVVPEVRVNGKVTIEAYAVITLDRTVPGSTGTKYHLMNNA